MSELFDMCKSIRNHRISFVLNPEDCWASFDSSLATIVNGGTWQEVKFLNNDATNINQQLSTVPNDKGGIYLFVLKPNIVPSVHRYILYVGRVKFTTNQNLRKRFKEYWKDGRTDIVNMRETWGKDLYIRYLPLTDNKLIDKLEKELIRVIIPPCNSEYPGILNKAMNAAF